jgi:hypothetical protein
MALREKALQTIMNNSMLLMKKSKEEKLKWLQVLVSPRKSK